VLKRGEVEDDLPSIKEAMVAMLWGIDFSVAHLSVTTFTFTLCVILRHFASYCVMLRHFASFCEMLLHIASYCFM
jgi:hypothetical protein